ncbi:glycosyltransferase 87 family protein [Desertivibrio insolitus]|uniref:glycosyltransferase 87 family protein n=1 Tax=Herbiconiux sp. SYSU D00978 TaxID=2812562 RepID=UPI001A96D876|nr:glycosyltransferase 87 family protein [Herbiconiux sp. SYSU D00978]
MAEAGGRGILRVAGNPVLLWSAFVLAHLWLGWLNLTSNAQPLGDVEGVYRFWVENALARGHLVGVDAPFVYPIVALVPMFLAHLFGGELYSATWLSLVLLLDCAAFAVLTGWGRRRQNVAAAWFWTVYLVLLGPIAMGRIDAITVPIALVGMLFLASRPRVAVVLLTLGAWSKVWPAALVAAVVVAARQRMPLVLAAGGFSALVVVVALVLGSGWNVASFLTQQASRGLQVEAPIATFWLWRAHGGEAGTTVYYDRELLTWQVSGEGVTLVSDLTTPLIALVLVALLMLGLLATLRGAHPADLLPSLSLALVAAMLVFNKVGSPQFASWFIVPVVFGLAVRASGRGRPFVVPAVLVALTGALTQVVYPELYGYLLGLWPAMLWAISIRNALYLVILVVAVASVVRVWREAPGHADDAARDWLADPLPVGARSTD